VTNYQRYLKRSCEFFDFLFPRLRELWEKPPDFDTEQVVRVLGKKTDNAEEEESYND